MVNMSGGLFNFREGNPGIHGPTASSRHTSLHTGAVPTKGPDGCGASTGDKG